MSDAEAISVNPPQGSVLSYAKFLKLLETRKVPKVDKSFLQAQEIASGNEAKLISGLKFLGLIDKEANATSKMDDLCTVGEKRIENLATIVRCAYSTIFDVIKLDIEKADSDTLINAFKTDYKMGSVNTAKQGAQIFVFLAQQAGIPVSQQILEKLSVSSELSKKTSDAGKKPRKLKPEKENKPAEIEGSSNEQIPIIVTGMHQVTWGDSIMIRLKKGDKSTREKIAKIAKQFLDMYVEEETEAA